MFSILLTGEVDELRALMDETVRASREFGYEWELGAALEMRAKILANRPDWAGEALADADESLEIFARLGDDWGAAESLSSRGEANERAGRLTAATEDYLAAIEYARALGARAQVAVLRARYAGVLSELDRFEEAEAILREIVDGGRSAGHEAVPTARLHLGFLLGRQGRLVEAREQLVLLRKEFSSRTVGVFDGFVLGMLAWLDNLDGDHASALDTALTALGRSQDRLSALMAPFMASMQLMTMARALAGLDGEGAPEAAARLLGLQAALLPPNTYRPPWSARPSPRRRRRCAPASARRRTRRGTKRAVASRSRRPPPWRARTGDTFGVRRRPGLLGDTFGAGRAQAFLRNLATASGAITTVIPAAQASVHQTESPTGLPCMRPAPRPPGWRAGCSR